MKINSDVNTIEDKVFDEWRVSYSMNEFLFFYFFFDFMILLQLYDVIVTS